jgi:hypothetical protein
MTFPRRPRQAGEVPGARLAPGLGKSWFGPDFIPSNWTYAERYTYLWTELIPVLVFIVIGMLFWWMGRRTRAQATGPALDAVISD